SRPIVVDHAWRESVVGRPHDGVDSLFEVRSIPGCNDSPDCVERTHHALPHRQVVVVTESVENVEKSRGVEPSGNGQRPRIVDEAIALDRCEAYGSAGDDVVEDGFGQLCPVEPRTVDVE